MQYDYHIHCDSCLLCNRLTRWSKAKVVKENEVMVVCEKDGGEEEGMGQIIYDSVWGSFGFCASNFFFLSMAVTARIIGGWLSGRSGTQRGHLPFRFVRGFCPIEVAQYRSTEVPGPQPTEDGDTARFGSLRNKSTNHKPPQGGYKRDNRATFLNE